MASQEMTLREVCLADHYDEALAAKDKRIAELEARCERYRQALKVIAGDEQCIDDTWSNETVARVALQDLEVQHAAEVYGGGRE